MKKILVSLTTLLVAITCYSQTTFSVGDYTYKVITNGNVGITAYNGTSEAITLPETVTNSTTTYNVTNIENAAFYNKGLTSLNLGSKLKTIGSSAFQQNSLSSLVIPSNVTTIGFGAFWYNDLASLTISDGVLTIGEQAFTNNKLATLTIPSSVSSLGDRAFARNELTSITLSNGLFGIGEYAFGDNNLTNITLPATVTSIGNTAFRDNMLISITSEATTPPTITTGGSNDSFNSNRSAIDLIIPAGTEATYSVNSDAKWTGFKSISGLPFSTAVIDNITYQLNSISPYTVKAIAYNVAGGTSVTIPDNITVASVDYNVTEIGYYAFFGKSLTNISFGDNVTIIDEGAFYENPLTTLVLPIKLETIADDAFGECGTTSVVFPNTLKSIGSYAFGDNSLTTVTIPSSVTDIGPYAFSGNQLTNLELSNGLVNIGEKAFRNNQLTTVTIPSSVEMMGAAVFQNNSLAIVTSASIVPPTIITGGSNDSFNSDRSGIDLTIPSGTLAAYTTDAGALWTGFKSVTEDPTLSIFSVFENQIYLYQSPNELNIVSSNKEKLTSYTIYNTAGATLIQKNTGENNIDISSLASGYYIIKLNYERGIITQKFLK